MRSFELVSTSLPADAAAAGAAGEEAGAVDAEPGAGVAAGLDVG